MIEVVGPSLSTVLFAAYLRIFLMTVTGLGELMQERKNAGVSPLD
jgi:hypothetical protein